MECMDALILNNNWLELSMKKPDPSNIRSYFNQTQETVVKVVDTKEEGITFLAGLFLIIGIVLFGYSSFTLTWGSWAFYVGVLSLFIGTVLPKKNTVVKKEVRLTKERRSQFLVERDQNSNVLWAIYDDAPFTIYIDFELGNLHLQFNRDGPKLYRGAIFYAFDFLPKMGSYTIKKKISNDEAISVPKYSTGGALVNGNYIPITVQSGYNTYIQPGQTIEVSRVEFSFIRTRSLYFSPKTKASKVINPFYEFEGDSGDGEQFNELMKEAFVCEKFKEFGVIVLAEINRRTKDNSKPHNSSFWYDAQFGERQ